MLRGHSQRRRVFGSAFPKVDQADDDPLSSARRQSPDLKENMLDITSYAKGVELLGEIAEKKIILPDGLADWLKKNDSGTALGLLWRRISDEKDTL